MKLIKFSASWCQPCKDLNPIFYKVVNDNNYNAIEIDINDDTNDLVTKYIVRNVPTIIITDDNNEAIGRIVGMQNYDTINKIIKDLSI